MLIFTSVCTYFSSSKWIDTDHATIKNRQLVFGAESPTFGPLPPRPNINESRRTIISRRISTVPLHLSFQIQLSYTLITASSSSCPNTDPAPPLRLEYQANGSLSWITIKPGRYPNKSTCEVLQLSTGIISCIQITSL